MFRSHHRIFLFPDLTLMNPVLSLKQWMFFVCPATLCLTDQFADQLARIPDYRKTHVKIRFFQFIFINIIQYCEALSCPVLVLEACLCKALPVITNSNKLRTYTAARYYTDDEVTAILVKGGEGA